MGIGVISAHVRPLSLWERVRVRAVMRIGVISDTHIPDRTDEIPVEVFDLFRDSHLILHAGDVCQGWVLERLETIAPVVAVRGNRDSHELCQTLPYKTIVSADRWRIGLVHGMRSRLEEMADRLRYVRGDRRFRDQLLHVRSAFGEEDVRCIIFGHTHQTCNEVLDGVLMFNPGGVTPVPGGTPSSVGILDVTSEGITGQVILLSQPPRLLSLFEQTRRNLRRRW